MVLVNDAFFRTVVSVVSRLGIRRTTVKDLSESLNVSRQTLYERFGDKDGIMAAAIEYMCETICGDFRAAAADASSLSDVVDAYYEIVVYPSYEAVQALPDAADLERGLGPKSVATSQAFAQAKREILTREFKKYLGAGAPAPEDVAVFFDSACYRAKSSDISRQELERFLSVLKHSILAMAKPA